MKTVVDAEGKKIGEFSGVYIKNGKGGGVIYWIDDNEVYVPVKYPDGDLKDFEKGQFVKVGELDGGQYAENGKVIFEIL